jgi:hypothetical protein
MKKTLYLLIIIFLAGCSKKEGGKLVCNMTYNLSNEKKASLQAKAYSTSERYTQFGDYITSVTPHKFLIKFLHLRLCDTWENQNNHLDIIDNNKLDWTSTDRIADFSENSTVNINIDGNIANNVEMIYLVSIPMFYYQEFGLPEQYSGFTINMAGPNNLGCLSFGGSSNIDYPAANDGIGGIKEGCIVKGGNNPLMAPIFDETWIDKIIQVFPGNFPEWPRTTVFGNTNSTFIYPSTGTSKDDPMGNGGDIIRSNKFNSITLRAIPEGETRTITGIMTFNTTDLIQIYAGKDNIPYTYDDVFVYAPKFWERISVSLNSY